MYNSSRSTYSQVYNTISISNMINLIEEGRIYLAERERVHSLSGEIFHSLVDVVQRKGTPIKEYRIFNFREIEHTFNSSTSPIRVSLTFGGKNPEKTRVVLMWIQGSGTLIVKKKGADQFKASEKRMGKDYYYELSENGWDRQRLEGYLSALRQVESELEV